MVLPFTVPRREAEIGLLLMKHRPPNSGATYTFSLKPCTGLGLPSGTRQQQVLVIHIKK